MVGGLVWKEMGKWAENGWQAGNKHHKKGLGKPIALKESGILYRDGEVGSHGSGSNNKALVLIL